MADRRYVPTHSFSADAPCFCGSDKPFGECCGSVQSNRDAPRQIGIVQNFLSRTECHTILADAEAHKREWLTTFDEERSTPENAVFKKDPARVTEYVHPGDHAPLYEALVRKALNENIAPFYRVQPDFFEPPNLLRYQPGGTYAAHADAEHYDFSANSWYRFCDRDISLLLYLNDDYVGGGLRFNLLNYTYQPQAGDLVFFPSSHFFQHESLVIQSGIKWALVCWAAVKNSPRVIADYSRFNIYHV